MLSRGPLLRNGAREMARLAAIEVDQGTVGGEMMTVGTTNIGTEVVTESETEGMTSTETMIAMIPALRERAGIEMGKRTDTIKIMTGGGKNDIEPHRICVISQAPIVQRCIGKPRQLPAMQFCPASADLGTEGTRGFPPELLCRTTKAADFLTHPSSAQESFMQVLRLHCCPGIDDNDLRILSYSLPLRSILSYPRLFSSY